MEKILKTRGRETGSRTRNRVRYNFPFDLPKLYLTPFALMTPFALTQPFPAGGQQLIKFSNKSIKTLPRGPKCRMTPFCACKPNPANNLSLNLMAFSNDPISVRCAAVHLLHSKDWTERNQERRQDVRSTGKGWDQVGKGLGRPGYAVRLSMALRSLRPLRGCLRHHSHPCRERVIYSLPPAIIAAMQVKHWR